MRETDSDAIMERVDQDVNLLGFYVLAVSRLSTDKLLVAEFKAKTKI